MEILLIIGLLMLLYLYGGYLLCLRLLSVSRGMAVPPGESYVPKVTVLITVHNEAQGIAARVRNVLECDYPADRLEVLVASDGSDDETDAVVSGMQVERVRLFRPAERRGKTDTQNRAMLVASGEVVIFTDADTRFDTRFISEMVQPFADPRVGGVDGHLLFVTDAASGVSQSQGFYWRQELQIRAHESRHGLLAVASGACMAIRRAIFRPMQETVGEDCVIPLDVVDQGYRMVHADKALAFDRMEHESGREFKTRVRMTLRNWQGTWSYPQLLNPFRHPGIAWALWSHKVLRWLSPVFMLMWLSGSLAALFANGALLGLPGALFMLAALAGAAGLPLPGVATAYSFCLANAGFMVGVAKAVFGRKISAYR
jgi:cellulose synthase/poly-beta-1,6-N-acetylglucosamine synthase-like glycosyltransferase